ncbi:hypothetical protein FRC04_009198 [Tulasnella sp. 424]|nr:hypothetical protein FRC04_009198 [Tulasnella sp. 424]
MFEDVCLVCGRIADGLYCSDVCRDADAVQLPPSSIDHAIDLGFITDSIPPLVSSARPPRNPEDPSAVSSPTSSILTTPSVLDELDTENSDHHLTPATNGNHQKGHDPSTITGAATTTMTSAGHPVLDSLLLPPTIQKAQPSPSSPVPHFHLPHPQTQPQTQQQQQPQQQIRSPRLQPTTTGAPLLPFARRPGNTNIHTPPPSTQPQHHSSHLHAHPNQSGSSSSSRVGGGGGGSHHHHHHHHHRRTASFNPASGVPPSAGVNPGGGAGTPGPILGGPGAGHASPFSPPSRGASGSTGPTTPGLLSVHHHHHHSSSSSHSHSRCSTSGHPSPALSPLRVADDNNNGTIDRAKLLANLEELDLDGARGDRRRRPVQAAPNHQHQHHHHHAAQVQEDHDALERARKRRARASLPAYFSNLVMGVAGMHTSSSKVPSTAVSSGTSSSDEQHKQQRQQQQRQQKIRHVRSKSAMRASDRSAAKLSTSASTFKVGGGVVGPTRSNSDGSVAEKTSQAQSPTTPTVLTRNGSRNQLLAYFNSSVTTTSTMTKDGRENVSPPPRGRDREKARGRVRGINTSVGGVAMTPSVEAIVSPITATRHSMTPPGVLINHDGTTAGGASPASYAEKHIRFIASSVANGSILGSRRMLTAVQGHLRSPPPPPASASLSGGKSGLSDQSPSSPIAIRPGSSSGRPPLSAGILEESVEVPFVVPAGSHYTQALAPRLHQRLGAGGPGVGGKVTMSPKSRRYSSPTTSTAGIGAGLHVPIALMMSAAIERPAKPTAIPGANQDKEIPTTVFGRGGRRNSRREEEMSPPRPVVRRGWSPVRGRGAAAVFDDDDEEEEEEEDEEKEENEDADEEEVEEEEEEEEEPQRGRSRSRMRSRSRARSRSLERERRATPATPSDSNYTQAFWAFTFISSFFYHLSSPGLSQSGPATATSCTPTFYLVTPNSQSPTTAEYSGNDPRLLQGFHVVPGGLSEASSSSVASQAVIPPSTSVGSSRSSAPSNRTSPASFATRATATTTTPTTTTSLSTTTAPATTTASSFSSSAASTAAVVAPAAAAASSSSLSAPLPSSSSAVRRPRESWTEVEDALNDDSGSFEREEAERARKRPRLDFNQLSSSSSSYHYYSHNNTGSVLVGSSSAAAPPPPASHRQAHASSLFAGEGETQQPLTSFNLGIGGSTSAPPAGSIITGLDQEDEGEQHQHQQVSHSGPLFLPPYLLATAAEAAQPPHPFSSSSTSSSGQQRLSQHPFVMQHHPSEGTMPGIGGDAAEVLLDGGIIAVHDATTPTSTLSSSSSSGTGLPSISQPGAGGGPPLPPFLPPLFLPTPSPLSSNGFTASQQQPPSSQQPTTNGFSKGKETNGFTAAASPAPLDTPPSLATTSAGVVSRVYLPGTTIYEDSNIDREEFVRLAIQIFKDIGYNETASTLEAESGYSLETPLVTEFRQAVLNGEWTKVSDMLPGLGVSARDLAAARYLVSQQHYLELLEQRLTSRALNVLRTDLAPNSIDSDRLHVLSSLMMCADPSDLRERAKWDGINGTSRRRLLDDLQHFIPTHAMLPQRRLATLLEHAKAYQKSLCVYHDPRAKFSLYTDHECSRAAFPNVTTNILEHEDEVWNMVWSRDGRYLASASKDKKATVWYIGPPEESPIGGGGRECKVVHVLRDHKYGVSALEWSLDGKVLITAAEQIMKMWDVESGSMAVEMKGHKQYISAIAALPDGSGYVSGGMDKSIIFWDIKGGLVDEWQSPSMRVLDLAVTPDGTKLVVVAVVDRDAGVSDLSYEQGFRSISSGIKSPSKPPSSRSSLHNGISHSGSTPGASSSSSSAAVGAALSSHLMFDEDNGIPMRRRIIVYDLQTKEEVFKLSMPKEITSLSISSDSRFVLINHAPDDLLLYDLVKHRTVRKFTGQQQRDDVIRSCFGGVDEDFILSGSEGEAPPPGVALAEDLSSPSLSNGDYDGRAFSPPLPSKSQSPARYSHPYRSDSFDASAGVAAGGGGGGSGSGTLWPRNVR